MYKVILAAALVCAAFSSANARDPEGKYANSPYHDWVEAQQTEPEPNLQPRSCCGEADAHVVAPEDIRTIGPNQYEVRINGTWMKFDKPVNPYHENPTGKIWVWYNGIDSNFYFICLRLMTEM